MRPWRGETLGDGGETERGARALQAPQKKKQEYEKKKEKKERERERERMCTCRCVCVCIYIYLSLHPWLSFPEEEAEAAAEE